MNDAPPQGSTTQSGHPGTDSFFDTLRRIDLRRSDDGWVGGVAAGIAARLGLDPIVIRAGFVLLGLIFGIGLLVYLAAWLLIPDTRDRTHLERAMREGEGGSIALLVVAVIVAVSSFPWWGGDGGWRGGWGGWWFVGLLLASLVFWGVWTAWERRDQPGRLAATGTAGPAGTAPGMTPPPPPPGQAHQSVPTPTAGSTPGPQYPSVTGSTAGHGGGYGQPPVPVRPAPRPKRSSGGAVGGLIAAGLALVAYGSLEWAARTYDWPGNHFVVAVAGALAVLGAVVLVLGLIGRRGGFAGFLAAMALLVTVVTAPLPQNLNVSGGVGERDWTPRSVAELEPFRLGVGEATLDLRSLEPAELDGQTVEAGVGIGQLTVVLPEDLTVRLQAESSLGEIDLRDGGFGRPDRVTNGAGVSEDRVLGAGEPDLVLDLSVGIGEIVVERN